VLAHEARQHDLREIGERGVAQADDERNRRGALRDRHGVFSRQKQTKSVEKGSPAAEERLGRSRQITRSGPAEVDG
jgi:hypothetical protein